MGAVWDLARRPAEGVRGEPPTSGHYEVAIVGAGITGLTCALRLAEAGRHVIVLEALRVGGGATGHSTGNLYSTLAEGLEPLVRRWGDEVTGTAVHLRADAVDAIEQTVRRYGIECDFARRPLYFVSAPGDDPKRLYEERDRSRAAGIAAELVDHPPLPFATGPALRLDDQAQFNPHRYAEGLAAAVVTQGGHVHEHSPASSIDADDGRITIGETEIHADAVVEATHTPKGVSVLQTALLPYREYGVSALLGRSDFAEGMYWLTGTGHSVRRYRHAAGDYVVAIGEKHKTGEADECDDPHARLATYLREHFAAAGVEHRWSAQQFVAADHLPYIGRAPGTDTAYVATGFAADGLVWGALAGGLIAELALGREPDAAALFAPTRLTPAKSAREWLRENLSVASHFTRDRLTREQIEQLSEIAPGEGRVVSVDGEKLAVCRDDNGRLSALSAVCPHMRCLVHWNAADRTWDCPCHGSRFRSDGSVLEGPAYRGLAWRAAQD